MRPLRTSVASATALFVLFSAASPLRAEDDNPKYSAKAPPSLQIAEEVESRIGMLKFFDGLPDGETTAKVLARSYGTIENFVTQMRLAAQDREGEAFADLVSIEGIGPVVAESIVEFFAEPHNIEVLAS